MKNKTAKKSSKKPAASGKKARGAKKSGKKTKAKDKAPVKAKPRITGTDPTRSDFFFEGEGSKAFAAASASRARKFSMDILPALKQDHDNLREFIEILKDEEASMAEKRDAFENFAVLLKSHAKAEEESVYRPAKEVEEMKATAFEGFEEHVIAEEMLLKIADTVDEDQWRARAKVVAELVEHHVQEEEQELFEEIEKLMSEDEREEMSQNFIELREKSQPARTSENSGVLSNL